MRSKLFATLALTCLLCGFNLVPVAADMTAMPGAKCSMPGMTVTVAKLTYLCQSKAGVLTWSTGLPVSKVAITLTDGWVKLATTGMSGAFGIVKNNTKNAVTIVGVASARAAAVQTHEMVMKNGAMVMQMKMDGFTIPAGKTLELKPGGNHLMLMGITKPIKAGDYLYLTLTTSTGGQATVRVIGKVFAGGNETYDTSNTTAMKP